MRPDRTDRGGSAAMVGLSPVAPVTGWSPALRLPRDNYIRLDSKDYSVHAAAVGRRVLVRADLDRVPVMCDGNSVAEHPRIWEAHQTISDPVHVDAAKVLRRRRIQVPPPPAQSEVPGARSDVL